MDGLTTFFTAMAALSVGVERIVEIIKSMVAPLRDDPDPRTDPGGKKAARRRGILQTLACAVGGVVAAIVGPSQFIPHFAADASRLSFVGACVMLGMMASGGSALWNHALDIVAAIKNTREQVVKAGAQDAATVAKPAELPLGP